MEDVGGRGDGIGPEEQGQSGAGGGGDEAPRRGGVAGDVDVLPGFQGGGLHLVGGFEQLGGLPEVVPSLEGPEVGLHDQGLAGVLLLDPTGGGLGGPGVEPADQAQGEEVLGALGIPRLDPRLLGHLGGDRGHRHLVHRVGRQRAVAQRTHLVTGLGQIPLLEGIDVHDDGGRLGQGLDIGPEGGGVHGHQHVGRVPRGGDVVVGDVDLERRDAGQGAGGGSDLGREVGEGGQVVPQQGRGGGEPVTRQLHAVPGVAGEPDDHAVDQVGGLRIGGGVGHRAPLRVASSCICTALSRRTRTRRCSIFWHASVFARINTQGSGSGATGQSTAGPLPRSDARERCPGAMPGSDAPEPAGAVGRPVRLLPPCRRPLATRFRRRSPPDPGRRPGRRGSGPHLRRWDAGRPFGPRSGRHPQPAC